jgi:serine/threonine-protein kinase RsbW
MFPSRQDSCRPEADRPPSGSDDWRHEVVRSPKEMSCFIEAVADAMTLAAYSSSDVFAMRLTLEEALANALKHGNHDDPAKQVRTRYRFGSDLVLVEIEDEGDGFDPDRLPDPLAPENLDKPSGRGVFLMRHYMTWVRYNERGNCVRLCKERSDR